MKISRALTITTIAPPTRALSHFAEQCASRGIDLIVAGDRGSPPDFSLPASDYWSLERQLESGFRTAGAVPENHYARKNIAYLAAIRKGHEAIAETDDDNLPYTEFWEAPGRRIEGCLVRTAGWINVYRLFTGEMIWPRGFPLEALSASSEYVTDTLALHDCPIQQGLADRNPDVDAVYRLTRSLPVSFEKGRAFILGRGSWCPFNSQNTLWFRDAFPLLYLPSECSFRMTDIWRSLVAQRIAWEYGWKIAFRSPTVYQERNRHDLLKDFHDEVPGYLHNSALASALQSLELSGKQEDVFENLRACYRRLVGMGLVGDGEPELLEKWIRDLEDLL